MNRVLADSRKMRPRREGLHVADIAERMERDIDEVAILIMDLARRDVIGRRKNGAMGEVQKK